MAATPTPGRLELNALRQRGAGLGGTMAPSGIWVIPQQPTQQRGDDPADLKPGRACAVWLVLVGFLGKGETLGGETDVLFVFLSFSLCPFGRVCRGQARLRGSGSNCRVSLRAWWRPWHPSGHTLAAGSPCLGPLPAAQLAGLLQFGAVTPPVCMRMLGARTALLPPDGRPVSVCQQRLRQL